MSHNRAKYNASEVYITRASLGLFAFLLMAAAVWGVSHFRIRISKFLEWKIGFIAFVLVCLLATVAFIVSAVKQKKNGADFNHTVFGLNYIAFLCAGWTAPQLFLLCTMPTDYWVYTVPMAYMLIGMIYVLYISAWRRGGDFLLFGVLNMLGIFGAVAMYQNYYNVKQNFIPSRLLSSQTVFVLGWVILAVVTVLLAVLYFKKKTVQYIWKDLVSLGVLAVYWLVLQNAWLTGFICTVGVAAALSVWYVLMCIFKAFKIVR